MIRHVDPWSILKLSTLLALCMWVVTMMAAAIMWAITTRAGTISSLENFVNSSLSLRDWTIDGSFLFRQLGILAFLGCIGFVLAAVLATFIFNLASDIMGGIWVSVIEEESARPVNGGTDLFDADDVDDRDAGPDAVESFDEDPGNFSGRPESILEDHVG